MHTVLSQWIPPHERAKAVSLTTSGMYLGSAAAMLVLPAAAAAFGPGALLVLVGGLGFAWLLLWLLVGREIPHRESVIPVTKVDLEDLNPSRKGRPGPTPWQRMLRSPAVWAIIVNNFAFHYAFYVVMNWLPTYFDNVLHTPLSALGALKTLPYLVMFMMSNVGGWLGDRFIAEQRWSVGRARKVVNTLGFSTAIVALMAMPGASGVASGVLFTTLTLGTLGLSRGGFSVNHMDIAPKYAGMVMGFANTAGTLAGVVGVAVTGFILEAGGGAGSSQGWYTAHAVSASLCGIAAIIFAIFARGDRIFD